MATYSKKSQGNTLLSKNFKVGEFACSDGSDEIKIDPQLPVILESLRAALDCTIEIVSGYRTPAHNRKIGGAVQSRHLYGQAADIKCRNKNRAIIPNITVCRAAEQLGVMGIEQILGGENTHVDVGRITKWRAVQKDNGRGGYVYSSPANNTFLTGQEKPINMVVNTACPYKEPAETIKQGANGEGVKWAQWNLNRIANSGLICDGVFGANTTACVKSIQNYFGLTADGIVGAKTRDKVRG